MRIAFTSLHDTNNIKLWSGTIYHMIQALKRQDIIIEPFDNLKIPIRNLFLGQFYLYKYLNIYYHMDREPLILKNYAKKFKEKCSNNNFDIIFSAQTPELTYINSKKPIVFWVDATLSLLLEQIKGRMHINKRYIEIGDIADRIVFDKAAFTIFSSEWAANSAIKDYNVNPNKVKVVPFGANLTTNYSFSDIKDLIQNRSKDCIKILFAGVDWERKGGDIVLDITEKIFKRGVKVELNIMGCKPEIRGKIPDYIKVHGFLNKNSKEGLTNIIKLFSENHFLIMPSRHEPFGIVFCEANSFGMPVIGSAIGGIPTIVKDGINGFLYSQPVITIAIAEKIIEITKDRNIYNELALSSYNEYKTRLNWDVSCKKVKNLLEELI